MQKERPLQTYDFASADARRAALVDSSLASDFKFSFTLCLRVLFTIPSRYSSLSVVQEYLGGRGWHPDTRRLRSASLHVFLRGYHPQWQDFPIFRKTANFVRICASSPESARLPLHFSLPLPHSRFISRSRFLTPASEAAARKRLRGRKSEANPPQRLTSESSEAAGVRMMRAHKFRGKMQLRIFIRFRSPLLSESRLISFPPDT